MANYQRRLRRVRVLTGWLVLLFLPAQAGRAAAGFTQVNLISSVSGVAPLTDPALKNPWDVSSSPSGPFWISNQRSGLATVNDGTGAPFPVGSPLVVSIPTVGGGRHGPTGLIFNPTSNFEVSPGVRSLFVFSTLDGTIAGWNPSVNPTSALTKAAASDGAVYTGLAQGNNGSGNLLYAADVANAKIDVHDGQFSLTTLAGSFTDPNLPAGFAPYNIENLGGTLFVTYENEVSGGGIVNAFDFNGNLLRRINANGPGGPLDDPWGLAFAPPGFGPFGGALLVGNEADGRISAFDPATGQFLGQLLDAHGDPIANPGLKGLTFGNGGTAGDPDYLYFTAGISNGDEGLFGSIRAITAIPEPSSALFCGLEGLAMVAVVRRLRSSRSGPDTDA